MIGLAPRDVLAPPFLLKRPQLRVYPWRTLSGSNFPPHTHTIFIAILLHNRLSEFGREGLTHVMDFVDNPSHAGLGHLLSHPNLQPFPTVRDRDGSPVTTPLAASCWRLPDEVLSETGSEFDSDSPVRSFAAVGCPTLLLTPTWVLARKGSAHGLAIMGGHRFFTVWRGGVPTTHKGGPPVAGAEGFQLALL